jgi:hypothetical protein
VHAPAFLHGSGVYYWCVFLHLLLQPTGLYPKAIQPQSTSKPVDRGSLLAFLELSPAQAEHSGAAKNTDDDFVAVRVGSVIAT